VKSKLRAGCRGEVRLVFVPVDFAAGSRDAQNVLPTAVNCGALIPCHNEAAMLGAVVGRLRSVLPRVLVVDDGSRDGSAALAAAAGAQVIRHPNRLGKGAALATGWAAAAVAGWEWVLMLDGDGQHAPEDAAALLAAAGPGVPLVIGNRLQTPDGMPWPRRATNVWLSRRVSRLAGVPLPDSQSGFRLAHLPTLLRLGLGTRHFEIESEMCVAFARRGHRIAFVPVTTRYGAERSKISPLVDACRWWRWQVRTQRSLAENACRSAGGKHPELSSTPP
jgi:glycosyltransferase involved in cell wall biosynthesis